MKAKDIRSVPITDKIFTKEDLDIAFKAGIKEVVEWLLLHTQHQYESFYQFDVEKTEWQAKLKEWEMA